MRAGFSYKITVNTNNIPVAFVIGQWGTYADLGINDEYSQFTKYGITGKITLITPHKSGMLYIADNNQTSLKILNINLIIHEVLLKFQLFKKRNKWNWIYSFSSNNWFTFCWIL
ncbi:hypothetical protein [Spiroplasma citri]|uniref:hypothetical protein n=1 Tax=Spiroplasma citri TaxID=2133 RepID=UPI00286FA6F1|nr:hypothetical protein [Spiroplasma citri]